MIAKHNFFNIRAAQDVWQGQVGQRRGFVEFQNEKMAVRAWLRLMRTYREKHQCDTIASIVTRFAPPSENNTLNYIRYCVEKVGKPASAKLEYNADYCKLAEAMAFYETNTRLHEQRVFEIMKQYNCPVIDNDELEDDYV